MDQHLQARLIGATMLVALAVLLIPELLSGRKTVEPTVEGGAAARGTRSFTIELGANGGQSTVMAPPASSVDAPAAQAPRTPLEQPSAPEANHSAATSAEPPVVAEPPAIAPTPAGGAAGAPPSPTPATAESPAPSAAGVPQRSGGWVVQVGAFGSADTARRLVDELRTDGYEAQVAPVTRSGRTLHRVRVGPAGGRPAAEQLAQRLKTRGLPATVVAND